MIIQYEYKKIQRSQNCKEATQPRLWPFDVSFVINWLVFAIITFITSYYSTGNNSQHWHWLHWPWSFNCICQVAPIYTQSSTQFLAHTRQPHKMAYWLFLHGSSLWLTHTDRQTDRPSYVQTCRNSPHLAQFAVLTQCRLIIHNCVAPSSPSKDREAHVVHVPHLQQLDTFKDRRASKHPPTWVVRLLKALKLTGNGTICCMLLLPLCTVIPLDLCCKKK